MVADIAPDLTSRLKFTSETPCWPLGKPFYDFSPIDPIEGLFDLGPIIPAFNTFGFPCDEDQYKGLSASPGTISSPSLPPSPFW